jgi:hypothetical protein
MIESAVINKRTFRITDRVKAYYRGKWWAGTVDSFRPAQLRYPKSIYDLAVQLGHKTEIIEPENEHTFLTYLDYDEPIIQIRTDEKVSEEENKLFAGYGIWYRHCSSSIIFECEKEYEPFPITVIENDSEMPELPF